MRLEPLIQRLERQQAEIGHIALSQPAARDAFEYGRMAGMYAGVGLAIETIKNIETEAEDRGNAL